ncbi:hypothetical protein ILUMI_06111 [Ignelater luminosus]|uniref:Lipase domain-containing protein n=1 Tax=Ignelater luminosus TaxID=2038154 RepID=A0A8K0GCW9_IGNLU|nr:hypothetical protein ILUMI_06111 [Ignelater luminosus]
MKVLLIGIVVLAVYTDIGKADLCLSNKLEVLPQGILQEFLSIITKGIIQNFFGCPDNVKFNEHHVRLLLFTREYSNMPGLINKDDPTMDTSKPIKLLIPDWLCNVASDGMPDLKQAYLQAYDCNVIVVDWTKYSIDRYVNSFCFVPEIAKVLGKFLCYLHTQLRVPLNKIHLVGYGMGGQMAGLVGQETQKQCKIKLERITGLDPAGPLYQGLDKSRRLDESDAAFVDVIHTNGGYLGYNGPCGTVDFFVNCGTYQPGCIETGSGLTPQNLLALPVKMVSCSHLRALQYFTESINSDNFVATSCAGCPVVCLKDIIFATTTKMGEYLTKKPNREKYWCPTNSQPPYAKG